MSPSISSISATGLFRTGLRNKARTRSNEEVDEPRAGAFGHMDRHRNRMRNVLVDVFMSANDPLTPQEMRAADKAKRWLAAWGPTIAVALLAVVGAIGFGLIIQTLR